MMHEMMNNGRPKMAIVYPNSLAIMGLRQLLHNIMPIMEIKAFRSFDEFEASNPDSFFHYFVADSVIIEHRDYFFARAIKTIVLTAIQSNLAILIAFISTLLKKNSLDLSLY